MTRHILPLSSLCLALTWAGCDSKPEDSGGSGATVTDADGDGYSAADDCDDEDFAINPGAQEKPYDGLDNDCDPSTVDDDLDGDGFDAAQDCDDDDPAINPQASEICNGIDDDCDDQVDEDATDAATWYADADGDGYGDDAASIAACEQPSHHVAQAGDCDDANDDIHPEANEICDGVDNDCDDEIDENLGETWYIDADGDNWGDPQNTVLGCEEGEGYVADGSDCDDGDAAVHPGADELCDGVDNDCDDEVDEDPIDGSTWYADADGDGYGDPDSTTEDCEVPSSHVTAKLATDCDDGDPTINPEGTEICDGVDNDCDGVADDEALDAETWYADADGDGHGDADSSVTACDQPSGAVAAEDADDCDDSDASINPSASESWYDGIDQDCDGANDYDQDADGYDSDAHGGLDCDDTDTTANPGVTEVCDGIDNDCDGSTDETDAADVSTWYADSDGDGYGNAALSLVQCYQPSGFVLDDSDCDDGNAAAYPDAPETTPGVDNNCDGEAEVSPSASASYDPVASSLLHCKALQLLGSSSSDPDGTALDYQWELDSAPTASARTTEDLQEPTSADPLFYPDVEGDYDFSLLITDEGEETDSAEVSVTISARSFNDAPLADAGDGQSHEANASCNYASYTYICDDCEELEIELDGTGSIDADDEPLEYAWTVASGSASLDDESSSAPTATLTGPTATYGSTTTETFEFELTVTDCFGDSSTADTVMVTYSCTGG